MAQVQFQPNICVQPSTYSGIYYDSSYYATFPTSGGVINSMSITETSGGHILHSNNSASDASWQVYFMDEYGTTSPTWWCSPVNRNYNQISYQSNYTPNAVINTVLRGKVYAAVSYSVSSTGNMIVYGVYNGVSERVKITLDYTEVPAHSDITLNGISCTNNNNGTATLVISASAGTNNPILSYQAGYGSSASGVPGLTSTQSSNVITLGPQAGSWYFYVRVNGTYNSPARWYGPYTITAASTSHPSVTAGSIITKAQMDSLRSFKNSSPTAVTQGGIIYASTGSTYASATAGNSITASWYNNS